MRDLLGPTGWPPVTPQVRAPVAEPRTSPPPQGLLAECLAVRRLGGVRGWGELGAVLGLPPLGIFGLISPTDLSPVSCQAKYFGLAGGAERTEGSQQTSRVGWGGEGRGRCRPPGVGDRTAAGARGSGRLPSPEPPASLAGHAPRALLCPSLAGLLALPRLCTPCGLLPLGASLWLSVPCPRLSGFTRSLSDSGCLSPSVCLWPSLFFPVSGHLHTWGSSRPCPSSPSPL